MMTQEALYEGLGLTFDTFPRSGLPRNVGFVSGKVRDVLDLGSELVIVTTDRISAFDRVLSTVPFKGQVLNQISLYWFDRTKDIVRNHQRKVLSPRTVCVTKCATLPVEVVVRGGTEPTGLDAVRWAQRVESLGAGAILPTSMDADGTRAGYDIPMTRAIADAVGIPVIASGGAGTLEHLYEAIAEGHADAVLVASIAHYGTYTIRQMKEYLASRGIPVRL